ncbi:MAG: tRNA uridine-5-carboxymethylaminomethyl(34) synthesis GTPase MnmE [Hyphomicrobiales bacterium]|nr:tRNA uridine-5-carboxymethylaminomethyl(34) synthesis GTPase MnmE [Hyphomicrobiales bacterium]
MSDRQTIFALSSGFSPAAIAVVRISGPAAGPALMAMIGRLPSPRLASLARVRHPHSGAVIDQGLALWLPAPRSETGEDMAELQVHGGRAVIAAVLAALADVEGCRPAEAGEFTRRAFENGRLDLTAVEGLADLIAAETESQRRQALAQLEGLLGRQAASWRERLVDALALAEASIDFSDEEDVPEEALAQAAGIIGPLADELDRALAGQGERLRDGLRIAIAGPPNAGKSTLFNLLARREAAIVSPYPGTTRDVLEVHLDLAGFPVTVLDTAGIRPSDDPIEQEGIRRASEQAARADLVLWVVDAAAPAGPILKAQVQDGRPCWIILNKTDLLDRAPAGEFKAHLGPRFAVHQLSCHTGAGVDAFLAALSGFSAQSFPTQPVLVTRHRHRHHLEEALRALREAMGITDSARAELFAEQLRLAARSIGRLLGRVDVEDVLDVIFRDFCIGK